MTKGTKTISISVKQNERNNNMNLLCVHNIRRWFVNISKNCIFHTVYIFWHYQCFTINDVALVFCCVMSDNWFLEKLGYIFFLCLSWIGAPTWGGVNCTFSSRGLENPEFRAVSNAALFWLNHRQTVVHVCVSQMWSSCVLVFRASSLCLVT